METKNIPDEIVDILQKLSKKLLPTEMEEEKLNSFLCSLEHAVINPVDKTKVLVNPVPKEVDMKFRPERTLEERIKHINTINHRIREQFQPETEEEQNDFESIDDSFDMLPKSIFEVADHQEPFIPEEPPPEVVDKHIKINPDLPGDQSDQPKDTSEGSSGASEEQP